MNNASFSRTVNVTVFVSGTFDILWRTFWWTEWVSTFFAHQSVRYLWHNVKLWWWLWHGDGDVTYKQTLRDTPTHLLQHLVLKLLVILLLLLVSGLIAISRRATFTQVLSVKIYHVKWLRCEKNIRSVSVFLRFIYTEWKWIFFFDLCHCLGFNYIKVKAKANFFFGICRCSM